MVMVIGQSRVMGGISTGQVG